MKKNELPSAIKPRKHIYASNPCHHTIVIKILHVHAQNFDVDMDVLRTYIEAVNCENFHLHGERFLFLGEMAGSW